MRRTRYTRVTGYAENPPKIDRANAAECLSFQIVDLPMQKPLTFCMALCNGRGNSKGKATMSTEKRAALYVRVSTDHQTVENQIRELTAIAERRGWQIVETYQDAGISGSKGRDERPALDQMLRDATRRKFDVVMAFAIDRLGRSLHDLLQTIETLDEYGVHLFVDKQQLDTTTPMGKLIFQVCGAFAEFEKSIIKQRVRAGIKRARAQGVKFGRPKLDPTLERKIQGALAKGDDGMLKIAARYGVGSGTVQRIKAAMEG
jgi:DNA invertase Pin-like site-specific DNA recombinase